MSNKKTILLLSDHPLSTSGVGTQSRFLVNGLVGTGKYSFRCFGGAIRHDNYETVVVNQDFIIKPTNGFGDRNLLRKTLVQIKPDALMLFTDPRFFYWVWEMSDEIRQICPIVYWHLWDNGPWPEFNRPLYESTDLINCINWPTYEMLKERFPEKTNYIPHSVPEDLYFPLSTSQVSSFKSKLLGYSKLDHFICLYVSRNARRKMPGDILVSWKMFLDSLEKERGHRKATLVMHTDPLDQEGTNLYQTIDLLGIRDNVMFSKDRIGFNEMNLLYNCADIIVNRSCAEGFGLPTLEAMMCGKPIIAIKTGGLTRQVLNPYTGEENGIALEPEVKTMVGNHTVPYIYEDFISHEKLSDAFFKMFEIGQTEREKLGIKAMNYAKEEYNMSKMISSWDSSFDTLFENWSKQKRWTHTEL